MPVVICQECGLIQTNPRMTQETYNEFYNSEYRKLYGGKIEPDADFFYIQLKQGKKIYEYLTKNMVMSNDFTNKLVVEIGCGAGGILKYFQQKGATIYGVDLGKEYIEYGREKYQLNIFEGTIHEINLGQKPDLIIFSHVLEHILDIKDELKAVFSLMDQQSILYIEVPGLKNLCCSYNMDFLEYLQNAHVFHFSLTTLKNMMNRNGFQFIFGNEVVQSVFKKKENIVFSEKIVDDHEKVLNYLKSIENLRKIMIIKPKRVITFIKGIFIRIITYSGLNRVYEKIRNDRLS
jgi:SAM-dependent methyltransferase